MPVNRPGNPRAPAGRRRPCSPAACALLDALEPRHLLTVDLSGSFLMAPVSVLSGTRQAVSLDLANAGTTTAAGTLTVSFYAALDGAVFDPNTAQYLGKSVWSIALGAGRSQVCRNSALPISAAMAAGTYRLYAVIDSADKFTETDETNNIAQSAPMAVAQPNYDLLVGFDPKTTLLPAIIAGQKTSAPVRVVVTNSSGGTATLPAGQTVMVQVVARPMGAGDATQDVVLNAAPISAGVGGLAPGKSRTLAVSLQFPAALAGGNYNIIAKVDTGDALAETDETNNEGEYANAVVVAPAFCDPTLAFDAGTVIPPGVVADGRTMPLKFDVQNMGNVKIPAGQTTSISIVAHNLNDSTNTPLQTMTISLSGLGSGARKTFTLAPAIPPALASGAYQIQATLATTATGDLLANDTAACATTLNVGPAFYNLAVLPPTSSFNPAVINGNSVAGTVDVGIKNLSNTVIPAGTLAHVMLALRPVGALDSSGDIAIGGMAGASLAKLAIGATRTLRISATIPAALAGGIAITSGDYQIVATVTPDVLVESTLADNTALGATVTIAAPFVDLAIISASQNFLTPAATGSTASGTVVLRNMGNVAVQSNVSIQFFGTPAGSALAFALGAHSFVINLAPGATSAPLGQSLTLSLPVDGLAATAAAVSARIDPASFSDANLADSTHSAGTVIRSSQYVDLTIYSATNPFSAVMNAGDTATGQVLVGNIGSGVGIGMVTISYYASLTSAIDGSAILLGSQSTSVSVGMAQLSAPIAVALTLPSPQATTTYKLLAQISAALTVDNNPNNNLTSVLGTVTVLAGP